MLTQPDFANFSSATKICACMRLLVEDPASPVPFRMWLSTLFTQIDLHWGVRGPSHPPCRQDWPDAVPPAPPRRSRTSGPAG